MCIIHEQSRQYIWNRQGKHSQTGNKDLRCECHSTFFIHIYAKKLGHMFRAPAHSFLRHSLSLSHTHSHYLTILALMCCKALR